MNPNDIDLSDEVEQHFRDEARQYTRSGKSARKIEPGFYDTTNYSSNEPQFGLSEYLHELGDIHRQQREQGISEKQLRTLRKRAATK
jgi:hypothetical protein